MSKLVSQTTYAGSKLFEFVDESEHVTLILVTDGVATASGVSHLAYAEYVLGRRK